MRLLKSSFLAPRRVVINEMSLGNLNYNRLPDSWSYKRRWIDRSIRHPVRWSWAIRRTPHNPGSPAKADVALLLYVFISSPKSLDTSNLFSIKKKKNRPAYHHLLQHSIYLFLVHVYTLHMIVFKNQCESACWGRNEW